MSKKTSDVSVKISVLIIAIILWSFVMKDVNPEIERLYRNIPVTYTNVSALDRQGLVIMDPQDATVDVRVAGSRSDLENFDESNISAQVDLSGYSEGQVRVSVTVGIRGYSSSVRVVDYDARQIVFTFDRIVRRNFPVKVVTSGELEENYILEDIDASDYIISITGPSTWVNQVYEVIAHVDIEGRTRTSTINVTLTAVDDEGNEVRGVEKEPNMVNLEIPILRTETVPIVLQTVGELPENYSVKDIKIEPSEVSIVGDNRVASITEILTEEIDVNTFLESESQEVELILPEGVELLDPDEKVTISYEVIEEISESISFELEEIASNIPEGLALSEEDLEKTIDVNLRGDRKIIEALSKEDIKISVDLTDLELGSHEVEIRIEDIEGIVIEAEPTNITITLIEPEPEDAASTSAD